MKKKIFWTWQKILTAILAFFGCGMLTACYGAPPRDFDDDNSDRYGNSSDYESEKKSFLFLGEVVSSEDSDGDGKKDALEGIIVKLQNSSKTIAETKTDNNGFYQMRISIDSESFGDFTISFSDADGEENGGKMKSASAKISIYGDKISAENTDSIEISLSGSAICTGTELTRDIQ